MIPNIRDCAVRASRLILQMMRAPLSFKDKMKTDDGICEDPDVDIYASPDFDCGEEGLAIQIAVEASSFHAKNTGAVKPYLSSLCRILILLEFRVTEQGAIKLMRRLLNPVRKLVASDKYTAKELNQMAQRLEAIDRTRVEKLPPDQSNHILEKLELTFNFDEDKEACMGVTPTHAPPSTWRRNRARRQARDVEESSSIEELPPEKIVLANPSVSRAQRACRTVASSRKTAGPYVLWRIDETDGETDDDTASDVTFEA